MQLTKSAKNRSHTDREPFMRIAKRENVTWGNKIFIRGLAVLISFLIIFIFLQQVTKFSLSEIISYLFNGSFATQYSKQAWAKDAMLLLGISIALAPAFKMKFWNIGAQGQILMGGLLSATLMWYFAEDMSSPTMIFLMFIVSILAGGLWAIIPALFKVKMNANETLFTLMMNYIAIQLVACCIDIWKGKNSALPLINSGSKVGWFPALGDNPYGMTILLIALIAVIMLIYLLKSKHGYEISVVGESINTARYAGINTKKVVLRTMFLSGAICGLVGMLYVGNVNHSISTTMGGNYGFTAIIVAWVAKFNPIIMGLMSFAIVFLEKGSGNICNYASSLNSYTAYIVVGIFLFLLIGCEFFINYKIHFNSKITASANSAKEKLHNKMPKCTAFFHKCGVEWYEFCSKVQRFFNKCKFQINCFCSQVASKTAVLFRKIAYRIKDKLIKKRPIKTSSEISKADSDNDVIEIDAQDVSNEEDAKNA